MNKKNLLGGFIALIGAVLGLWLNFKFFMEQYPFMIDVYQKMIDAGDAESLGCQIIVKYFYPIMTDVGILSGVFWALSAYGFFGNKNWAYPLGVVANVLALWANLWVNIPPLSTGHSGPWFMIFLPNLVIYFILLRFVGEVSWKRIFLGLLMEMAYILTFINSIAATNHMLMIGYPIFVLTQRLNMIASFTWFFTILGLILTKKKGTRYIGIGASIIGILAGFPLAIASVNVGFSMFYLGPSLCLILLVLLSWPDLWDKITINGKKA